MRRLTRQTGFTLIELLLAMAFIAMIFMLVATVTMQMMAIYNRGIAMKQIDQVGSSILSDVNQLANSGLGGSVSHGTGYLCVGDTGYFWNPAATLERNSDGNPNNNLPFYYFDGNKHDLVGVVKTNSDFAAAGVTCNSPSSQGTSVNHQAVTDLVGDNVRIYQFNTTQSGSNRNLVQLKLVIGTYTNDGGSRPQFKDGTWQCPPSGLGNFCAVGVYQTVIYLPNSS